MAKRPNPKERPEPEFNLQDTVRLSADGLAKVLGDLEARVMRTVWSIGRPASARGIHERVVEEHEIAHLTVVTVLNKLVDKGLLEREKEEGIFHYRSCWTEAEFRARVSRRLIEGILSFEPHALASSFVDVLADRDPSQLSDLRRLIDERLRQEDP